MFMIRRDFSSKKSKGYYIGLYKQIVERERDWKELLKFAATEVDNFNDGEQTRQVQGEGLERDEKGREIPFLIKSLTRAMTSSDLAAFGDTQSVANIVHALAKLKQPNKAITSQVNEEAGWMVKEGKPQEIANTA